MPSADVVVVGAGLAGLTAAVTLAEAGARVHVLARGHAATHWTAGTLDVAAPPGTAVARDGVERLSALRGHPYRIVGHHVEPAIAWLAERLAAEDLPYAGDLDSPVVPAPTAVGRTRLVSIVPDAQRAALAPWQPGERLLVCGPVGFKDFAPELVAAGLSRPVAWRGHPEPDNVDGFPVELRGLDGRHNLDALRLARLFDEPDWRRAALARIAREADRRGGAARARRIAFPAVLGLDAHADVMADARAVLGDGVFEIPLVPPSVPGLRLYRALRAALLRAGGRIQVGEPIARVDIADGRVTAVAVPAAAREYRVRTGAVVLATGGIAGGGLVAGDDGSLREAVLDLPVERPPTDAWLARDPFAPEGHLLESAGVRTDVDLRPMDSAGRPAGPRDVRVVGSLLAGQRYLRERCGDGVAVATGWRAAHLLSRPSALRSPDRERTRSGEAAGAAAGLPAVIVSARPTLGRER